MCDIRVFTCPRSPGRGTLRTRSKANNFIGGLHNSAPIPGVIVFSLRLSCGDESLMHSCLGIMDGAAQLLPGPAAGDGSEGGMNGDVASVHIGDRWSEGWADGRT